MTVRWSLVVSDATDRRLRSYLVRTGGRKGDLSRFVDRAVRQAIFWESVQSVWERNRHLSAADAQALADDAVARGPVRIVLDTNILVSASFSPDGPPGRLLAALKHDRLTLITSGARLSELRVVLSREHLRADIPPEDAEDLLAGLEVVGDTCWRLGRSATSRS